MCKVTKKNYTHKYFKPIYLFLRILGAKKGMEHKKRGCVISPDNGSKVGLKAQKLLAQGIALGNVDKKQSRPETQGVELQPEEVNVRLGRVSGKKAQKMKGTTAIPVSGCIA